MDQAAGEPRRFTSVQIYQEDAEWLRAQQREISAKRGSYVTIYQILREVINHAKDTGKGA